MNDMLRTVLVGVGATLLLDLWGVARRPLLGWPVADYAPVGRWLGHMARGRFRHVAIARAAPVPGERVLGWMAHYLTGILFAAALVAACGSSWLAHPAMPPALLAGLASLALPLLVVQPAMGAGFAASRLPRPGQARLQAVATHVVFGLGLYIAALLLRGWENGWR